MQPNVVPGSRAPQLGQYQRSNYGYAANPYRQPQRPMAPNNVMAHQNAPMGYNYVGAAASPFTNLHAGTFCNISDTIHVLQPLPASCNLRFRKLPFYNLRQEILRPSLLSANHPPTLPPNVKTSATQEFQFAFVMTCAMASEISMNRDITKNEFTVQAQLRITMLDSPLPNNTDYDDFLPLGLFIRVNGRQCTTLPPPSPCSRQNQESRRIPRPISVTQLIKISPMNANVLTINWAPEAGRQFIITLNLVEKLSSEFLLTRLKEKPKISVEVTKVAIRQQYRPIDADESSSDRMNDDEDISTTIVRVSLLCPLAKFRMHYPAKGKDCAHLQCFDGSAYISLNEKKPMWNCPVCNKVLNYDDLLLDEYFMNVIQNEELSSDCQEVQLFVDGTWKSYFDDVPNDGKDSDSRKGAASSTSPDRERSANSPENGVRSKVSSTSEPTAAEASASNNDIVDLLSDDEDTAADEVVEPVANAENTGVVPTTTVADTVICKNGDALNGGADAPVTPGEDKTNTMETDDEVSRASLPVPDPSTIKANAENAPSGGGVISLDSPSPPAAQASPAVPPMADLNI